MVLGAVAGGAPDSPRRRHVAVDTQQPQQQWNLGYEVGSEDVALEPDAVRGEDPPEAPGPRPRASEGDERSGSTPGRAHERRHYGGFRAALGMARQVDRALEVPRGLCQIKQAGLGSSGGPRLSHGELTPFGQSGRSVLLEEIPAVEVAILVEVVVDRGVNGGELLQSLDVPELRHRALSSSKRLM